MKSSTAQRSHVREQRWELGADVQRILCREPRRSSDIRTRELCVSPFPSNGGRGRWRISVFWRGLRGPRMMLTCLCPNVTRKEVFPGWEAGREKVRSSEEWGPATLKSIPMLQDCAKQWPQSLLRHAAQSHLPLSICISVYFHRPLSIRWRYGVPQGSLCC